MDKKPGAVTTVQVLLWISVGATALLACIGLGLAGNVPADLGGLLAFSLIITVADAILNAVIAVNLGNRKNWARITGIVVAAVGIALTILTFMSAADGPTGVGACVSPLLNLLIIGCLTSGDARRWCRE